jgi:hypothetical protein
MTHQETSGIGWNQYLKHFEDRRFIRIVMLRTLGNWLILLSIFFTIKIFYEPIISEVSYFINTNLIQKQYIVVDPMKTVLALLIKHLAMKKRNDSILKN